MGPLAGYWLIVERGVVPGTIGLSVVSLSPLSVPGIGQCLCWRVLEQTSIATHMSAARQLLEALENLHKARIVHRGE